MSPGLTKERLSQRVACIDWMRGLVMILCSIRAEIRADGGMELDFGNQHMSLPQNEAEILAAMMRMVSRDPGK